MQRHKREIKAKKYPQLHKRWHLWRAKIYQRVRNKFHSSTTKFESQNFHRKKSSFARKSQKLDPRDQTTNDNTDFFLFWVSAFKMWISSKNVIHPSVDSSKSVHLNFFLWILQECKPNFLLPPVDSSRVYLISFFSSFLHKLHHNIYAHQPN